MLMSLMEKEFQSKKSLLAPYFWSYDFDALPPTAHRYLIIFQVLNWGSCEATDWLRSTYTREEIQEAITSSIESAWDKKSLALWSLVFDVRPTRVTRFAE
jgi:hypothetical protein